MNTRYQRSESLWEPPPPKLDKEDYKLHKALLDELEKAQAEQANQAAMKMSDKLDEYTKKVLGELTLPSIYYNFKHTINSPPPSSIEQISDIDEDSIVAAIKLVEILRQVIKQPNSGLIITSDYANNVIIWHMGMRVTILPHAEQNLKEAKIPYDKVLADPEMFDKVLYRLCQAVLNPKEPKK